MRRFFMFVLTVLTIIGICNHILVSASDESEKRSADKEANRTSTDDSSLIDDLEKALSHVKSEMQQLEKKVKSAAVETSEKLKEDAKKAVATSKTTLQKSLNRLADEAKTIEDKLRKLGRDIK